MKKYVVHILQKIFLILFMVQILYNRQHTYTRVRTYWYHRYSE